MFAEWLIITSASLFFAVFTTPILHGMFIFSISFFGHFSKALVLYSSENINFILQKSLLFLYYSIPNLELLNFKTAMLYQEKITPEEIFSALFLTASWSLLFIIGACIIFSKRKLA